MAQIVGGVSGVAAEVNTTQKALRTAQYPIETVGAFRMGMSTGGLTGVAAGGAIFSLRYTGSGLCIIKRVFVSFTTTTAFTAAQVVDYDLVVSRSWSAAATGGTSLNMTGNTNKARTSLASSSAELRSATTAALASTGTPDTNPHAMAGAWSSGIGIGMAPVDLIDLDGSSYPIVCANNEGILVRAVTAMGATGVTRMWCSMEWIETTTAGY